MLKHSIIFAGKLLSKTAQTLKLGNGSTWPGHLALKTNSHFIRQTLRNSGIKTIIVAGTNGKTTTSAMIAAILEANNKKVLKNASGANLLNGIASALILNSSSDGKLKKDYAILEIDENALPLVLQEITPDYIVLLNLFRDQLDRYGEVNTIASKWSEALSVLPASTTLVLNADDPQIAYLGTKTKTTHSYFSCSDDAVLHNKSANQEHAVDSLYCPNCGEKLFFKTITFSHLGNWECSHCGLKKPEADVTHADFYPLPGMYNKYNTHAALSLAKALGIASKTAESGLKKFTPVFGRQEEIVLNGKKVRIFLSKNPTGFNESLRTIKEMGARHILFVLNDRIPDGKDVSWIWDTDIESILDGTETITVAGDRVYDIALRIKYAKDEFKSSNVKFYIEERLEKAITSGLEKTPLQETLYILPTYTAMLETRKFLTGKEIL